MGFGRTCAPVRCAHPTFGVHCYATPPPIAASLLLIRSPKIDIKKLSNSGRPSDGLSRNKMLSFRLELGPPASWASFLPLYHRGYFGVNLCTDATIRPNSFGFFFFLLFLDLFFFLFSFSSLLYITDITVALRGFRGGQVKINVYTGATIRPNFFIIFLRI